jgi:Xaa-Pro aminopeptidase
MRLFASILGSLALLAACAASAPPQTPGRADAQGTWASPTLPPPTPITAEEFRARRAALAEGMQDGVLVVFGAREPEADYLPYAQNVAFRYLTGILEPGAALIVHKEGGQVRERLFVLPRNPAREIWEGVRLGADGAAARTGIPAFTTAALEPALDSLAARAPRLYTLVRPAAPGGILAHLTADQQAIARLLATRPALEVVSLQEPLRRLRAVKSPAELDRIRRAVYITVAAHRAAQQTVEPGMNEFEIHALIEYFFRRNGAERPAFSSIVGSGPNSTTLHYRAADRFMQPGELVLMDVGASYDGYAADVTRTVPVSGQFSPEQRAVYEIVLTAQKRAEERTRVGATWRELSDVASRTIADGLARLGLIDAPDATFDCAGGRQCPQHSLFFMHGLGHGIGLEVHDPDISSYGGFAVGSAFTIEPGIYVRSDVLDHLPNTPGNRAMANRLRTAVQRYQDIGVRIEDAYILTEGGLDRISAGAPREIADIEALMRSRSLAVPDRQPEVVEWYRWLGPR